MTHDAAAKLPTELLPSTPRPSAELDPLLALDALGQAEVLRAGQASAAALTRAALAQIERLNPKLNAVVSLRAQKALAEAEAMDALLRREGPELFDAQPFAGVPTLIKDLEALKGEPHSYGSRLCAGHSARSNEPTVGAMLDAGMIALGKTNTPEFGFSSTTEPMLFGPTRNPWDLSLSPGGSSGGAAAAVASGMVALAQGGDGGGSIRIPASACGVFGFKPSRGRGLAPSYKPKGDLSVKFCLTRSVRDAAMMLHLLENARARADRGAATPLPLVSAPLTRPLRIALASVTVTGAAPDEEVRAALDHAAALCRAMGHEVEEAVPEIGGMEAVEHFLALWGGTAHDLVRKFPLFRVMAHGLRFWRWPVLEDAFEPWTLGLAAHFAKAEAAKPGQIARAEAYFAKAGQRYAQFFERYDVMLSPVQRRGRLPIGEQAPTLPFETLLARSIDTVGYTPVQNALGTPAMSVPLYRTADGVPIGVQFSAAANEDALLLGLALALEQAQPWAGALARFWPPICSGDPGVVAAELHSQN
ncbi:MAG: amidase family protein [Neomegalonema sp.]|nr:amidase family protein [Neomegalonema sp.]